MPHTRAALAAFQSEASSLRRAVSTVRNRLNELRRTDLAMQAEIQLITKHHTGNMLSQCLSYIVACQRANRERTLTGRRCRPHELE